MRRLFLLALIMLIVFLYGCERTRDIEDIKTTPEEGGLASVTITKEYIINHSDLEESDFEGIDFEDFISKYNLTAERLEEYDPAMVLAMYKEEMLREPVTDYTTIYSSAEGTITEEDFQQIETLIWEYHEGNYTDCMVIDFKISEVFYDQGFFLDACGARQHYSYVGETDHSYLERLLMQNDVAAWKKEYIGTNEGTSGDYYWKLGIKMNDGRCFFYTGKGVLDSGAPITLRPLMKELINHFSPK